MNIIHSFFQSCQFVLELLTFVCVLICLFYATKYKLQRREESKKRIAAWCEKQAAELKYAQYKKRIEESRRARYEKEALRKTKRALKSKYYEQGMSRSK